MVNGFVSAISIKTINCMDGPFDRHLNDCFSGLTPYTVLADS